MTTIIDAADRLAAAVTDMLIIRWRAAYTDKLGDDADARDEAAVRAMLEAHRDYVATREAIRP